MLSERSSSTHGIPRPSRIPEFFGRVGHQRSLTTRERLYSLTRSDVDVHLVVSGALSVETFGHWDGALMDLAVKGDVLGASGLALAPGHEPIAFAARAIMPTTLISISLTALMQAFERDPAVWGWLLGHLSARTRRMQHRQADMVSCTLSARVASMLCTLTEVAGDTDSLHWRGGMSQRELAGLIGADRATVNRVLNDFEQRGWLLRNQGVLTLTNFDRLAWHGRRCRWLASTAVVGCGAIEVRRSA